MYLRMFKLATKLANVLVYNEFTVPNAVELSYFSSVFSNQQAAIKSERAI